MEQQVMVLDGAIYVNGIRAPEKVMKSGGSNVTTINNKIFVNGYEFRKGVWKRTLRALWHNLF